jgi:hypothetical protein
VNGSNAFHPLVHPFSKLYQDAAETAVRWHQSGVTSPAFPTTCQHLLKNRIKLAFRFVLRHFPSKFDQFLDPKLDNPGTDWTFLIVLTIRLIPGLGNVPSVPKFVNGATATARDLAGFLYKINFLTARKVLPTGEIDRKYFEENRYLSASFSDFGYDWEIHPAYRWALQPDSITDIYERLELSSK